VAHGWLTFRRNQRALNNQANKAENKLGAERKYRGKSEK
jgi:hypothetical protein